MARSLPPQSFPPRRLTRLGKALADRFEERGLPIITNYDLFLETRALYASGRKLYLRKRTPNREDYIRARNSLIDGNVILPDLDYPNRAYKIPRIGELPADQICCIVDPFCYVSHLSAMQRFGLTDRRPKHLMLSRPRGNALKSMRARKLREDYPDLDRLSADEIYRLQVISHPAKVRRMNISVHETLSPGDWIPVRSSQARISTIGQTFVDMIEEPTRTGGMAHVIDVWTGHARLYLEDIIAAVESRASAIAKVRAGYLLDEVLAIGDSRIRGWQRYAQRGGSRRLDPTKPYAPRFSESWMISVNV